MRRAPARPVRGCLFAKLLLWCCVQEHDLRTTPVQCNVKQTLSSHFALHPSDFTSELFSSGFMHVRKVEPQMHFTQLAQSTSH